VPFLARKQFYFVVSVLKIIDHGNHYKYLESFVYFKGNVLVYCRPTITSFFQETLKKATKKLNKGQLVSDLVSSSTSPNRGWRTK
jgi:hypothetical protein